MTDTSSPLKVVAVIPAHLASVRFANKILFAFSGHPMVEHVRRRALLARGISDVYVATCDDEIAEVIEGYGGKVIMTGDHHLNGTTRVADAIQDIDCTHVVLLQGDEPLLLPRYIEAMVSAINRQPAGDAWNCLAPLISADELDRKSFVKCFLDQKSHILCCFRRSPSFATFEQQREYVFKVMGMIGYRKEFLLHLVGLSPTPSEQHDFIEQMRILEHGYNIAGVKMDRALPSVNEPGEAKIVASQLENDPEQSQLLLDIFKE